MRAYFKQLLCLLVMSVAILGAASQASAETSIAVVDIQRLLTESKAAKDVQKQVQEYRESFLSKISQKEQGLRQDEQEIIELKPNISTEDFAQRKKAFEEKLISTRKMAQGQKRDLNEATVKAMAKLEAELYTIVQEIADEEKYTLVLSRQNVVLGEKSLDISDETMKRLNKRLSKIKLDLSSK